MPLPNNESWTIETDYGIGILTRGNDTEESTGIVHLTHLEIDDAHQKKGHGGQLLEALLDDAIEFGYTKIVCHARPLNQSDKLSDLVRFYESHGFQTTTDYVALQGTYLMYQF